MKLDILSGISEADFVENYIAKNEPAIISDLNHVKEMWHPNSLKELVGELSVQVYDSLFDLQNISTLSDYLNHEFGHDGDYRENVPYVRWYNKLKDVDYAWGDEAFQRLSQYWTMPSCLSEKKLVIPVTDESKGVNPVRDCFPYRGILVAARGARTRLHRDPFCSDAVVSQFYGKKEIAMYHPSRERELSVISSEDGSSFGGFIDVRQDDLTALSVEPDYHGYLEAGQILYIPHGWLHDVISVEDSVSITWNFVHERGALEYIDYLMDGPEGDSEFNILKHFYRQAGKEFSSSGDIVKEYNHYFSTLG